MACTCLPYEKRLRMAICGLRISIKSSNSEPFSSSIRVSGLGVSRGNPVLWRLTLTNHVIAVLITYQILQITVSSFVDSSKHVDDFLPLLCIPKFDAGLHHVACKLLLRVDDNP